MLFQLRRKISYLGQYFMVELANCNRKTANNSNNNLKM